MSVDVKKLKVNELKEELRRRGLDTRGLKKAALVERLKAALGNKLSNDFPSDDEEEDDGAGGILETNGFSHMRFVEMMVEVKKEQEEAEEISAKAQECLPEQWEVKKEEVEEPQSGNGSDQQPGNDQPSEQVKAEADRSGQHSRKRPHDEGGGYGYYEHRNDKRSRTPKPPAEDEEESIDDTPVTINAWHMSLSRREWLLNAIVGDNSEVEDLSDGDADDPGVEQLSDKDSFTPDSPESDQQSSDDSDSEPQLHPRRSGGQCAETVDVDDEPEPTNGGCREHRPGHSKDGWGERWRSGAFTPDLVQFEAKDERLHERESWQPLDYVEQYIDTELMKHIANCTNAGSSLNISVDELYYFFGASIWMSCMPYPEIRMFWSNALRVHAISDKITRDRFLKMRNHLKVVIDDDISEDMKETDRFWKMRPFMDRILKGCLLQARPECVSIDEQMIPFTGSCPFRQYVPLKPNPVGMRNFVLASAEGIVLDFEVYQGANALSSQVQEAEGLGLGALVIKRLAKTLHPGTKVYCDRFFTTMKAVDQMLEKQVYLTGTVMKNRVTKALQKLPSDQTMKWRGRGASASVTRGDGKVCVVKWNDNKPVLMLSAVHAEQPEDICQRWSKKDKQYVTVTRPSIVREYNSKMGGVDLVDSMMSYYRMSVRTKKWTIRMLMHFTDVALANSWLLYRQDNTERGTPRKSIMKFLEFRMTVAQAYLTKCDADVEHVNVGNAQLLQQGKKHQVTPIPHVSVHTTSAVHLPEMVNLKNPMRCRVKDCSGKSRVRCVTCNVFLCLTTQRNCYAAFHTGQQL